MSTSLTRSSYLEDLTERGYTLILRDGRLAICPAGAPPEIVDQVRAHRAELIAALLHVPEHLADMPLEDMKTLAWRMIGFIDGPASYEERIRFLPEYKRLVERINWRIE